MISHDHSIKFHTVHDINNGLPFGKIGPYVPLNHVTGRKEDRGLPAPQVVDLRCEKCDAAEETFLSRQFVGESKPVKVVDMENPEGFRRFRGP